MKKVITLSLLVMWVSTVLAFHPDTECARCHLVHMATDNIGVPLWNGAQTISYDTFTAYYDGFKMDAQVGANPEGSTLLCLSCHDGGTGHSMTPAQGDMSGTHPIEFEYNSALATTDGELVNPETTHSGVVGSDGTIAQDLLSPDSQVMNCVTCHDIHIQGLHDQKITVPHPSNGTNATLKFDVPHLVNLPGIEWSYNTRSGLSRRDPAAYRLNYSALCKTCHVK